MAHRNAVADTDRGEFHGRASCHADAGLDRLRNPVQLHVPRDNLVLRTAYADDRTLKLFVRVAHRIKKRAVGSPRLAFGRVVTFLCHFSTS